MLLNESDYRQKQASLNEDEEAELEEIEDSTQESGIRSSRQMNDTFEEGIKEDEFDDSI